VRVAMIAIFIMGLSYVTPVSCNEYSQPDFYEVDHYVLGNGMHVILEWRHRARNVAIELYADVGHHNFPCGKRETA